MYKQIWIVQKYFLGIQNKHVNKTPAIKLFYKLKKIVSIKQKVDLCHYLFM